MGTTAPEPFGFELVTPVPRGKPSRFLPRDYDVRKDEYGIVLPHQCDSWVIAADTDPMVVLAEAKRFRAELDAVIVRLAQAAE
jgi:hypothetical protein